MLRSVLKLSQIILDKNYDPPFPCSVCAKNVKDNQPAILCSCCSLWSHNKCNNINKKEYKFYQDNTEEIFLCRQCRDNSLPFSKLNDIELAHINKYGINEDNINLSLNPTPAQQAIIDKLNNYITQANTDDSLDSSESELEQPLTCSYFSCDDFVRAKFETGKNFSIFHLNIHSIQLHIKELRILLNLLKFKFDVIAISESKLKKGVEPQVDISLNGYRPPYETRTEAEKGGTLLYVSSELDFKPRKDLEIYESKVLESSFIEIINKKASNDIVGVIYRHPNMNTKEFIDNKLSDLLNKLSKEHNKKIYISGDFNFDLLKSTSHPDTADFYNKMSSNLLLPSIIIPTKINTKNDTLIDNIFSNQVNPDLISGNLTVNFSDGHLPSFVIIPKPNQNHVPKKHNLFKRDMKNFDRGNFLIDLAIVQWDDLIVDNDADKSFDNMLSCINKLLDKYAPLKKVTKQDLKRQSKPWITNGLLTSIKRKDKLFHLCVKTKNENIRLGIHTEYKKLRNKLNELIELSKKNYYGKYFTEHSNNIKKIWIGIKEIVNIKPKDNNAPSCIEIGNQVITDNIDICNKFNNYFSTVADNI